MHSILLHKGLLHWVLLLLTVRHCWWRLRELRWRSGLLLSILGLLTLHHHWRLTRSTELRLLHPTSILSCTHRRLLSITCPTIHLILDKRLNTILATVTGCLISRNNHRSRRRCRCFHNIISRWWLCVERNIQILVTKSIGSHDQDKNMLTLGKSKK